MLQYSVKRKLWKKRARQLASSSQQSLCPLSVLPFPSSFPDPSQPLQTDTVIRDDAIEKAFFSGNLSNGEREGTGTSTNTVLK